VLEERTGDLQRQLLLAQSELKSVREDAQIQELDKAHLQTQLAGDAFSAAHHSGVLLPDYELILACILVALVGNQKLLWHFLHSWFADKWQA